MEQKKFVFAVNELFKKFDNVSDRFVNIDRQQNKSEINYNPEKYVRGYGILDYVNEPELPNVERSRKKTKKHINEDYLRNKNKINNDLDQIVVETHKEIEIKKDLDDNKCTPIGNKERKYSYEHYLIFKNQINSAGCNSFNILNETNNYSNIYNMPEYNKKNELKDTIVIEQNEFFNKDQMPDALNPYSSVVFEDFKPKKIGNYESQFNISALPMFNDNSQFKMEQLNYSYNFNLNNDNTHNSYDILNKVLNNYGNNERDYITTNFNNYTNLSLKNTNITNVKDNDNNSENR
jgi:hypothetical protein